MDRRRTALEVVAEVGGVEVSSLAPETELVAHLGIDSPKALHLLVELEDRLGVEIDDDDVVNLKTVGDVLEAIERLDGGA